MSPKSIQCENEQLLRLQCGKMRCLTAEEQHQATATTNETEELSVVIAS